MQRSDWKIYLRTAVVVVVIGYLASRCTDLYYRNQNGELVAVLPAEFAMLPITPPSSAIDDMRVFNHGGGVGVSRNFKSNLARQALLSNVRGQLEADDWVFHEQRFHGSNRMSMKFCRKDRSLTVSIFSMERGAGYGVSLFKSQASNPLHAC